MDSFNIQNYFKRGKTVVLTLKHGDDEVRQWSDKSITDLLKLMKAYHPEFQNQNRRKKEVWEDVSNALCKSGYTWTPEDCRKKWSNMIRTFKAIEEQKQENGQSKKFKWPFYDIMLQLLTLENSDAFPEATTIVQILSNSASNSNANVPGSRKSNNNKSTDSSKFTSQLHQVHDVENIAGSSSQFVESQQERADSINLVSDTDLIDMGVSLTDNHETIVPDADIQTSGSGIESSIIFSQPTSRLKSPSEDVHVMLPSSSSAQFSSVDSAKPSLAVKAKKRISKGKRGKDNQTDESLESILIKFMDTTKTQNEQMLEKMTSFQENALVLMQQRNELLKDIRDSLHSNCGAHLVTPCEENLDDNDEQQGTLTLHVGPAFSINTSNGQTSSNSQLNSSLVIPNTSNHSSGIPTFQLADGTMLSSIDGTHDKAVLTNLTTFTAESVLPDDDDDVSLLHQDLVSVVPENEDNSSDMTITLQAPVLGKRK